MMPYGLTTTNLSPALLWTCCALERLMVIIYFVNSVEPLEVLY